MAFEPRNPPVPPKSLLLMRGDKGEGKEKKSKKFHRTEDWTYGTGSFDED
jgi:hypothetical protein